MEVHQIQVSWRSCQKVGKIWYLFIVVENLCFNDWIRVDGSGIVDEMWNPTIS